MDDLDQLVYAIALAAGELDERSGLRNDRAALRRPRDRDSPPTPELEQPLVAKLPERAQDGVGVDLEHRGEIACRWKPLARLRLAVRDRASDLRGDLLVELGLVLAIDLDNSQDAINTSTIVQEAQP